MSNALKIETAVVDKAFKENIIKVKVNAKYIGSHASIRQDVFVAKAYLEARKKLQ